MVKKSVFFFSSKSLANPGTFLAYRSTLLFLLVFTIIETTENMVRAMMLCCLTSESVSWKCILKLLPKVV